MVDLHTHILFNIDDGAFDLAESIKLIEMQLAQNVKNVVLTPHYNYTNDDYQTFIETSRENYNQLKAAVKKRDLKINLKLGSELLYNSDLHNKNLSMLTIENTDYLLIEFSTQAFPIDIKRNLLSLLDRGYLIILAHIERYGFLRSDLELFYELVNMGIIMQVNANTFINGSDKNFINACIKHNLIHIISSDAHNLQSRKPNVKDGLDVIAKVYGEKTRDYFINNANSIFENEIVEMYEPTRIKKIFNRFY